MSAGGKKRAVLTNLSTDPKKARERYGQEKPKSVFQELIRSPLMQRVQDDTEPVALGPEAIQMREDLMQRDYQRYLQLFSEIKDDSAQYPRASMYADQLKKLDKERYERDGIKTQLDRLEEEFEKMKKQDDSSSDESEADSSDDDDGMTQEERRQAMQEIKEFYVDDDSKETEIINILSSIGISREDGDALEQKSAAEARETQDDFINVWLKNVREYEREYILNKYPFLDRTRDLDTLRRNELSEIKRNFKDTKAEESVQARMKEMKDEKLTSLQSWRMEQQEQQTRRVKTASSSSSDDSSSESSSESSSKSSSKSSIIDIGDSDADIDADADTLNDSVVMFGHVSKVLRGNMANVADRNMVYGARSKRWYVKAEVLNHYGEKYYISLEDYCVIAMNRNKGPFELLSPFGSAVLELKNALEKPIISLNTKRYVSEEDHMRYDLLNKIKSADTR